MIESHHINGLTQLIQDLARLDEAGRLEEVELDVAHYTRGSADPLENCTLGDRLYVHDLARTVQRLLDIPSADALAATVVALLPTRQHIAREVVARFLAELDGTTPAAPTQTGTPAAIERQRAKKAG